MQKLNRPTGLIAYDSIMSTNAKKHGNVVYSSLKHLLHPKVLLFGLAWLLVATAIIWATITKDDTEIALLHDRSALFAVLPDYSIRNTYTLKIANKTLLPRSFTLSNATNQGVEFKLQGPQHEYTQNLHIDISAGEVWEGIVFIKTPKDMKTKLDDGIELLLNDTNNNETYAIKSAFIYPEEK
jgi:polyferredoxin